MTAAPDRQILIGVHVTGAGEGLAATLSIVFENTPLTFGLRILPDSAAASQDPGLLQLRLVPGSLGQRPSPAQLGAAACFTQLVSEPADIYVFLENGVRVCPGWLELLLAALDSDASHGLAGPSTNRGWNEQAVAPNCGSTQEALWDQADALLARYGNAWVPLAPLHSLADFCYVVKNEVVAPVHDGLLEANKRLYQDRFCAWRRESHPQAPPYHDHCVGDDCRYFAVPEQMRIFVPLPGNVEPAPLVPAATALPLLSCVMPTRGRAAFVAQSIRYFQRQDYPALELIIVYEEESDLPAGIDDPRIRCIRMPARTSIGAKRNEAVRVAWGELIAHWDDDDWYGAQRLSRQAAPILHNLADVTGLNDMLFMARPLAEFWASSRALFRRLFVENVSGGTLVFRRSLWEHHGRYPDTSLREDADFLLKTLRGGARLCRISGRSLCIYVRHDGNTWKFKEGHYLQQAAWTLVPAPECLSDDDRDFYFPAAPGGTGDTVGAVGAVGTEGSPTPAMPLVSCIMPTADRREFVPQAIRIFLAQDYEPRELIVLDDGRDSVADLIQSHGSIRYLRLDRKSTLGAKRNMACELWRSAPFADIDVGEDNAFVWSVRDKRIATNQDQHLYVARVHDRNTSPKDTWNRRWHSYPVEHVERLIR